MRIFRRFWAARHILRANCAEINKDKLRMKFSVLNVDFLGSRKPAHESINERYSRKSRYFTVDSQSFVKAVAHHRGHAAYHNKH